MKTATLERQASSTIFWLASLMFFLSGGTGLAYQVIWFKRFAHVWGSSSLAFASVGGSFLFGLGVGAYLLGRYADRIARPLRWYGFCELAIGIAALIIPLEIQFLVEQSAEFYWRLPGDPLLRYLLQFGVTLLVVGPPCVLMGGTLPLLIRELTARDGRLDQATGWLYAINTFGAAAGCFMTGFWLLPANGLGVTNQMAAALNISIGVVAVFLTQTAAAPRRKSNAAKTDPVNAPAPEAVVRDPSAEPTPWNYSLFGLYVAVTLSGLGALILEMTWSRQLSLLLGGSSYTYSATLFVVLVGIAAGSLAFHLGLRRYALNPWLPIAVIGALAVSCLLAKLLLPQLALALMADIRDMKNSSSVKIARQTLAGNAWVCVWASACLELIPSIAMGILFPLFVDLTRASAARVGRAVGDVYAWNTFGSILGASLTAVLLFPLVGTFGSIALATGLYVVALFMVLPRNGASQFLISAGCLAVGAGIVAGILLPQDPLKTNMGLYMYGNPSSSLKGVELVYFAEGASSNVLVASSQSGNVNLRVNGKVDASDGLDMVTQAGLAYIPRLFKPDAQEVLVIGFGSGTTSGVSLLFPGTHVTCCEIEPAVYRAAKHFAHVNHRPHEQTREALLAHNETLPEAERLSDAQIEEKSRFKIVFGDGRTTLQGSDQKYDLIISEPSNPWLAGVSNLFTREFFQAARTHLQEGGVLAQWVQTYNLTLNEYWLIVRTLRSEFPHCIVCAGGPGDTLLLASEKPLGVNPDGIARLQKLVEASPEIGADLQKFFNVKELRQVLLQNFTADERSLDILAGVKSDRPLNTDMNLLLEFLAPLHLFTTVKTQDSASNVMLKLDVGTLNQMATALGVPPQSAGYQQMLGLRDLGAQRYASAVPLFEKALAIDPKDTVTQELLLHSLREAKDSKLAVATLSKLLKVNPDNELLLVPLAEWHADNKEPEEQKRLLTEFAAREPKKIAVRDALARMYVARNEHAAAFEVLKEIDALRPDRPITQAMLGQEMLALKRPAEAAEYFRNSLKLQPKLTPQDGNWLWANNLAWIHATSKDPALRNGAEAVRLAKEACESVDYKQMGLIDTLACAYAENGQFDEAIKFANQYLEYLKSNNANKGTIVDIEARIKLYESGKPFRDE